MTDCLIDLNSTCCSFIQSINSSNNHKILKPFQTKDKQTIPSQLTSSKKSIKQQINIKNNKKNRQSKKQLMNHHIQPHKPFRKIKDNYHQCLTYLPSTNMCQVKTLTHSPRSFETLMSTRQIRYSAPLNIKFSYHNLTMQQMNNPQEHNHKETKHLHQYIEKLPLYRLKETEQGLCSPRTVVSVLVDSERQSIVDRSYWQY